MLMEENMEEKVWISHDNLALQKAEKSLYDALGEQYHDLPNIAKFQRKPVYREP